MWLKGSKKKIDTMAEMNTKDVDGFDRGVLALLGFSVMIKMLLIPSYTSTDFEVHRNWLAITNTLPRSQWYHEATSEWTLDYPPFFALFEYLLSLIAVKIDPKIVEISATPIFNHKILLFQRFSVIFTDLVLFYAVYSYCSVASSSITTSRGKRLAVMFVTFMDAGLLLVDHIHFQYNGMLLGLLILSIAKFRQEKDLQGAFLYSILLMMKHIYLYIAPLYFVYLLRHYCFTSIKTGKGKRFSSFDVVHFLQLGILVLSVFGVAFGWILAPHPNPIEGFKQVLSRLFPVQRGLCHAYWAPNVWALYAFADKALVLLGYAEKNMTVGSMSGGLVQEASFAVLPLISPAICGLLTLGLMLPALWFVWKTPRPQVFMNALVYCMLCSFLLGYHVHEKAILQVVIPLALLSGEDVFHMRLYRFASWISTFSLFPLLFTPAEHYTKVLLALGHGLSTHCCLVPWVCSTSNSKRRYWNWFERLYLIGLLVLAIFLLLVFPNLPEHLPLSFGPKHLPFFPLMLTSITCAIGNLYVAMQSFRALYQVYYNNRILTNLLH
jgi:alpha-1,3-glucosyltransferase